MIVCFMAAVEGKNFATILIGPCSKGRINESGISLDRAFLTDLNDFEF